MDKVTKAEVIAYQERHVLDTAKAAAVAKVRLVWLEDEYARSNNLLRAAVGGCVDSLKKISDAMAEADKAAASLISPDMLP